MENYTVITDKQSTETEKAENIKEKHMLPVPGKNIREVKKEDGRYLIYYDFKNNSNCK